MAQYIQAPFDAVAFDGIIQVSQISYHDVRVIEILYEVQSGRVVIQDNGNYFYLTSPDIPQITINQALIALGYENDQAVVTWVDHSSVHSVLNEPIATVPLNQIALYPAGHVIPENHYEGVLPMIAGEPVVNDEEFGAFQQADYAESVDDPNNDDNQSICTFTHSEYKAGYD